MRGNACWGLLPLFFALWAQAAPITLNLPNRLVARAEYQAGKPDKPAVLLLHGFLQTHDFPTIYRLAEALHGKGYTVLAPTLTLGISHRKQSLACEAIHTHTLRDDTAEIQAWVRWLRGKQHGRIVLVGHSFGVIPLLAMLEERQDPAIAKLIGVSIVEGHMNLDARSYRRLKENLARQLREGARQPVSHAFSFCRALRATPASLLSYMEWDPERILASIARIETPQTYIMGDMDDRLLPGWIERLQRTGKPVRVIHGADHFMEGAHEFDLFDLVVEQLGAP